jgi:hypothetical protein
MAGLQIFVDDAGRQWKDDVVAIAGERFERRLGEEIGAFRVEVAKQFADFRVDMAKEFAAVRAETAKEFAAVRVDLATGLAATRVSLIKLSFLFWIGQVAAIGGIMALLLRTLVPR